MVQNGSKIVQNGSNVSKMGPKGVQKGSKRGSQKGSPRSEPKKSRKIFFLWPQSTKKVTHVPFFEKKKKIERKKNEKKIALHGGVVPHGGLQGGVVSQGGCRGV